MPFRDPFADQLGPRVLGKSPFKPPPEIPPSLLKAMRVRIRAEKSYIPDPLEEAPLSMVDVDLDDLYDEPEPVDDELTPEQRQVLLDL